MFKLKPLRLIVVYKLSQQAHNTVLGLDYFPKLHISIVGIRLPVFGIIGVGIKSLCKRGLLGEQTNDL